MILTVKDVELKFEGLTESAKTSQVRDKLGQVHAMLKALYSKGIKPSIAVLVKHLGQDGVKISDRAFYNKRKDGNLYRQLFDAWEELGAAPKEITIAASKGDVPACIIESADLEKIDDQVLRYRVSILLGELKGLRQQVDILRHAASLTSVMPNADRIIDGMAAQQLMLDDYDLELLEDMLSNYHSLGFSDAGALTATSSIKRGTSLSKPGLKDVVEKVLKSYEMPLLGGD